MLYIIVHCKVRVGASQELFLDDDPGPAEQYTRGLLRLGPG